MMQFPQVDDETFSRRPTRTKFFFNPKMITNREMALLALTALVEGKETKVDSRQRGMLARQPEDVDIVVWT